MPAVPWSLAMETANTRFYSAHEPAHHFRTSMIAAPVMARAMFRLVRHADDALGHPAELDLIDVGAADGALLDALLREADAFDPDLAQRLRPQGCDLRARPAGLDQRIAWIHGAAPDALPSTISGIVIAHEWLDDVPVDLYQRDRLGEWLRLDVDPSSGDEHGVPCAPNDAGLRWILRTLDPMDVGAHGSVRFESGYLRDARWATVSERVRSGLLIAIDYTLPRQPWREHGTLTGFLAGQRCTPVPDGSMNITAHVALDTCERAARESLAAHGRSARSSIVDQHQALAALAPDIPADSVLGDRWAALASSAQRAELTDADGLGRHQWLVQAVEIPLPPPWS